MSKTVLITGTSSGIGRETVKKFLNEGWNVIATMPSPEKEMEFKDSGKMLLSKLDVNDISTIKSSIEKGIEKFYGIDVLVNNAGYGVFGLFKEGTHAQIREQFNTNVFGHMDVIYEILPHFKSKKDGIIINVTSMVGLTTFPVQSLYNSTKWAMEGFSESLYYELRLDNIKIKTIEPGIIKTDFYDVAWEKLNKGPKGEHSDYEKIVFENIMRKVKKGPTGEVVADVIYKAATDNNFRIRYAAARDAKMLLFLRKILPYKWYMQIIKGMAEKGYKS